jgi:hypothetical protein
MDIAGRVDVFANAGVGRVECRKRYARKDARGDAPHLAPRSCAGAPTADSERSRELHTQRV